MDAVGGAERAGRMWAVHWLRTNQRLILLLALASLAVLALEATPVWSQVQSALGSLDFDAGRSALIQAWLAGFLVALLGAALTGRAWVSATTAAGFVMATYALPWAWTAAHPPAPPFAAPPHLDPAAFAHNLGVIGAVALLLAIPAAASGWLVRSGLRPSAVPARPHRLIAITSVAALVAGAAALAAGVDPIMRYGPDHGLYRAARPVASSQVLQRTFACRATGTQRSFAVFLPPGYSSSGDRRYPVVYLLHGDPGGYRDWLNLGAPQLLNDGVHSGALPPAILVMPDGGGPAAASSEWADSADGHVRVESSVLELVQLVDKEYRTIPDAGGRIVAGLSEGGFGATNLAARHPHVFSTAVSLSGYFDAHGPVFGDDPAYLQANSPTYLVQHQSGARSVEYVLVVGKDDARYRSAAGAFAAQLARAGVAHRLIVLPGGHEGAVWKHGLAAALQLVLPAAASGGSHAPGENPLSIGLGLALGPLAGLIRGRQRAGAPLERPQPPSRTARLLRAVTRGTGRIPVGAAGAGLRTLIALAVLADVALAADAWITRHHAWHSAMALALAPLAPLRLLVGGALAAVALYVASRARRSFRYLLVGLAAIGGILAITSDQPLLIAMALADCALALLAGFLWPESSHLRSSLAGWALLLSATAVSIGLFMFQHPQHKLASLLTLLLVMAFAAAVSGLTLLDRNAAMPNRRDPRRARELHDAEAWAGVSPFALVGRKRHFWAADASAVLAYGCRAGVALALGPALGGPEAAGRLHKEFRSAARRRGWRPALYQVSAGVARELGWGHRYLLGSEAIVDLGRLSLQGPENARLRRDVARGRRTGVRVEVLAEADLEGHASREMAALARRNAERRRLGEMAFSVGRRSDDCQVRRSMGIVRDASGRLVAYTTWLWVPAVGMVVLDEIQRSHDSPPGAVDLLMWSCLKTFGSEARLASLGLAPIAGSAQAQRLARLEAAIRRVLGLTSVGPGLYSFKAKFSPSWEPRYLVAESWLDWPAVWLAVFQLHFPDFVGRWIRYQSGGRTAPRSA